MQKAKWLSGEALQIAVKRREVKRKGEKERYKHLNAEFQRIARRDKKAFFSDQCKEIAENTTTQNLWDTVKAVLRGKFIAIQAYLKRQEKSQINNLTLHLKQLEKEEMKNPRVSRRKEILKIRAKINAKETKETIAKINKAKS